MLGAGSLATVAMPGAAAAAFGWSDDGSNYVVDTGASLVFKVSKTNGDLTSLVYKGKEYQGYGGKNSHVESGLGTSTVTIKQSGSTILISVTHGTLKHYYAARSGENNVYLWTNKADASVTRDPLHRARQAGPVPQRRARLLHLRDRPPSRPRTSSRSPTAQTRSKHYSKLRVIDYDYIGWSTGSVGLWIVRCNHEKASGGPFYRSLLRHQSADGGGLYEILYYGENQTEAQRFGLQGPYVIAFTDGGAPSSSLYHANLTTSWADSLGISGYVGGERSRQGRGRRDHRARHGVPVHRRARQPGRPVLGFGPRLGRLLLRRGRAAGDVHAHRLQGRTRRPHQLGDGHRGRHDHRSTPSRSRPPTTRATRARSGGSATGTARRAGSRTPT